MCILAVPLPLLWLHSTCVVVLTVDVCCVVCVFLSLSLSIFLSGQADYPNCLCLDGWFDQLVESFRDQYDIITLYNTCVVRRHHPRSLHARARASRSGDASYHPPNCVRPSAIICVCVEMERYELHMTSPVVYVHIE